MSETNQVDFTKFVGKNKGIVDFTKPFVHYGWMYATDGVICVRKLMPMANNTDGTFPSASMMKEWKYFPLVDAKELAEIKLDICKCDECYGIGFLYECPECYGLGDVYWDGEYSHQEYSECCHVCKGDGEISKARCDKLGVSEKHRKQVKCGNCEGTGNTFADSRVTIDGTHFKTAWMAKIVELPNVLYKIVAVESNAPYYHGNMMLFESGDVQGLFIATR